MKYIFLFLLMFTFEAKAANVVEQWNLSRAGQFVFSATTTSQLVLSVNDSRGYLMIQNSCASTDTVTITVKFIQSGSEGIQLTPCSTYEFDKVPTNSIWVKANSGTQSVIFLEGNNQ